MPTIGHEDREDKLPKWARDKFEHMRRLLSEAMDNVEHARNVAGLGDKDRAVGVGMDSRNGHPAMFFPLTDRVQFRLGKGLNEAIEVYYQKDVKGERLCVRGHDVISIWPTASNSFDVRLEDM